MLKVHSRCESVFWSVFGFSNIAFIIPSLFISVPYFTLWLFVCFVALRPKSTAMVIAGRSVHLTTLFPGQAWTSGLPVIRAFTFACNWQQPFLNKSAEGRRMTVEIISWSISTKVWDRTGIELATPGSAVRHVSVARHVTDCATRLGFLLFECWIFFNTMIRVSNSLDPDQARHFVGPDLGPNCLQRLSADDKSCH